MDIAADGRYGSANFVVASSLRCVEMQGAYALPDRWLRIRMHACIVPVYHGVYIKSLLVVRLSRVLQSNIHHFYYSDIPSG